MTNDCQILHETILRDIFDIVTTVKDHDEVEWIMKPSSGSIAKRASNLTLVFPALCTTTGSINSMMLVAKALERKCVGLLQILFSATCVTNADDLQSYVNQFHKNLNLKTGMDLDEFMGLMDELSEASIIKITDMDIYNAVKEDMKNLNYYLPIDLNPTAINDYKLEYNTFGESTVLLAEGGAQGGGGNGGRGNRRGNNNNGNHDSNVNSSNNTDSNNHTVTTNNYYGNSGNNNRGSGLKDQVEYYSKQITSSELKKANELMPTTMIVNFTQMKDGTPVNSTGVIGVKVKLYPVDSMDVINRLSSKYKDSNGLFNLIRATTREISFFKDFAFMIDKAKIDAVNMAKDSNNARLFRILERRATKNKFSRLMRRNDASPITSLIITQEEVEYLKKYNNLDLDKAYNARTIMEAYNIMDIVIVDESLEVARFLFDDGDGMFETLTFDALEKESSDGSYKKVVNLMSKMSR